MTVPPLKNNCFAMPAGVDWTPVDDALAQIEKGLHPVVGQEEVSVEQASGRILASAVAAKRSNPPLANSAVDGYGFCHGDLPTGDIIDLPLQTGVSAAGTPFDGRVQAGYALRILTGATIPKGIDTVVLEEDIVLNGASIAFRAGLRKGANLRPAAEDVALGQDIFNTGHVLRPQDLALLAATGVHRLLVYKRLKVAVISTGTELVEAGEQAREDQIYDANRPMLLNMIRAWGFDAVDGGHYNDNVDLIRTGLNTAAQKADAIFVSGGASAGDEDYVSKLLKQEGTLHTWRVAVKPGRPIAMALWNGIPTFGFPGNPVAAFVCALIFGLPALKILSGHRPGKAVSFQVPAGFVKSKKPGRREYLRARIDARGQVQVFKSEGSGRISGLAWSDGLVELPDAVAEIKVGDLVTYIPYASFGLFGNSK
jgi:molybdopterin molybdotransferase